LSPSATSGTPQALSVVRPKRIPSTTVSAPRASVRVGSTGEAVELGESRERRKVKRVRSSRAAASCGRTSGDEMRWKA